MNAPIYPADSLANGLRVSKKASKKKKKSKEPAETLMSPRDLLAATNKNSKEPSETLMSPHHLLAATNKTRPSGRSTPTPTGRATPTPTGRATPTPTSGRSTPTPQLAAAAGATPLPGPIKVSRKSSNGPKTGKKSKEDRLGPDMTILAEGFKLDKNSRSMLVQFDAKTLEDFSLMNDDDFDLLVEKARSIGKELPPLQVRKVQVLREWVQGLCPPDERVPASALMIPSVATACTEITQGTSPAHCADTTNGSDASGPIGLLGETPTAASNTAASRGAPIIPDDWHERFTQDLPRLKHKLKEKGEQPSLLHYLCSLKQILC